MKKHTLALLAATAMFPLVAQAADAGDILIRLRVVTVAPNDGGRNTGIVPALPTGAVNVTAAYVPEVDLTYFLTSNLALETICCVAHHSINGYGAIAGLGKIGSTWVTPFTLNLQYHADFKGFKPYIGAGPSWAIFYGEGESDTLKAALGNGVKLDVKNKFGADLQAGVDIPINDRWFFNADFKYYFVKPYATLTGGALTATQSFRIKLDPVIAGIGFGYRF